MMALIVKAALLVLVRREMPLSRRLYSWILGPDDDPEYFLKYGKPVVVMAVRDLLCATEYDNPTIPITIVIYLLDKENLGSLIIEDVLIYVLRYLVKHENSDFSNKVLFLSTF